VKALRLYRQAKKLVRLASGARVALPREIQLEVTNRCNLDCDMCPRLTLLKVPEIDMSRETFDAVLARLDAPESITLTGWGEPLMHPQLFEFVSEINRRWPSCDVSVTTNGHLLTERLIAQSFERKISRWNVSLEELPWDDKDPEAPPVLPPDARAGNPMKGGEHRIARDGHPTPPKLVERLRSFLDQVNARRREGKQAPEVRLQVVLFPNGTKTALRLIEWAADTGFHAVNLVRLDVRGRPDLKRPSWDEERAMIMAARACADRRGLPIGSVNDHGLILGTASHRDSFCMRLDNFIYVDVAGNVAPCCLLRGHRVGNLVKEPLQQVWEGEKLKSFYGPSMHPACDGCDAFFHGYAKVDGTQKTLPVARELKLLPVITARESR
jgi:MoaA/NifB/PqqE/SkfB family radical SAM enzyme